MTLTLAAHTVAADAGAGATTGTVQRTGTDNTLPLTVSLSSSAPGAATVPGSVVIAAGQASATFSVDVPSGYSGTTDQAVTISASASADVPSARDVTFRSSSQSFGTDSVAVQSDGRIVVAGSTSGGFAVQRFNADGTPDASFRGGTAALTTVSGQSLRAQAVAVQGDGKVLVGGAYQASGDAHFNFVVARYNTDGTADTSFGTNGVLELTPTTGYYNEIWALAVQADGKILLGGDVDNNSPTYDDFAVIRLNPTGTVDTSFGSAGVAKTSFSNGADRGFALAVQGDGRIVLAGSSFGGNSTSHFAVARFTTGGQLDTSFNGSGKAQADVPGDFEEAKGVAIQPDGKVVVVGYVSNAGVYPPYANNLALVRYNANGTPDAGFGSSGIVIQDLGGNDTASSVVALPDGLLEVAGSGGAGGAPFVARFQPNGTLENSVAGVYSGPVQAMALQPGGRVVVAGGPTGGVSGGYLDAYTGYAAVSGADTLTVTAAGVPKAVDDSFDIPKDNPWNVYAPGVLVNDTDPNNQPLTAVLVSGPQHGSLTLNSDGSFTYTPVASYLGPDSFTYKANDGTYDSAVATVSLNVTGQDDPPFARDDSYTVLNVNSPNGALSVPAPGVLGNDFDPNGQPITAALATGPSNGALTLNADGSFTYTPNAGFYGTDTFTYQAGDGTLDSSSATVTITVTGAPVAVGDAYTVDKGTSFNVPAPGVLANDTDPNGLALSAVLVSGPKHGALSFSADGSFIYTPLGLYLGTDSFTYRATDGTYTSNTATVTLNVAGADDPPVSKDDAYSLFRSVGAAPVLTVSAPGVLGNDSDANGQAITAVLATGPSNGTLTLNANGSFSYTPNAGFYGTDTFTYRASDGTVSGNLATVSITVSGAPVAVADSYTTLENTPLDVAAPGVLANDSDPNGLPLTPVLTGYPSHGSLTLNKDGSLHYVPAANYSGSDSFNYYVSDGKYTSTYVTDKITITHVNQPPTAVGDSYTLDEDTTLTAVAGVTSVQMTSQPGDYIGQGKSYSFSPANATITARVLTPGSYANTVEIDVSSGSEWWTFDFVAPNNARLVPGTYDGATRWPFEAANTPGLDVSGDGRGSNTLTGSFTVYQALYDASGNITAFAADFVQHSEGATAALTGRVQFNSSFDKPEGVLFNDTDPDPGTTLAARLVGAPSHGSATLNADGSFAYTPAPGYSGPDAFTYVANDGQLDSNLGVVNLTINKVDHPPVAQDDRYSTRTDVALTVTAAAGVLADDTDPDHDPLTASVVASPAHGTLALNPDGSFTYTPDSGYYGADSFTYKANDGTLDSNVATVSLVVDAPPVAADDSYALDMNQTLDVPARGVLANDADPDGDPLSASLVASPAHGTLALNADGSFEYVPDSGYHGADSFTYTANDGLGGSNVATVHLAVNAPPVANPDLYRMEFNTVLVTHADTGVLANDTDPDGDPLTAVLVAGPRDGALTLNPDGSFEYSPNFNYSGPESFFYKVFDGRDYSPTVGVTITINGLPVANDDSFTVNQGWEIGVGAPGVLANDTDQEGDPLTAILVSNPQHGSLLSFHADGSFTYAAPADYIGPDSFTYEVSDGTEISYTATVHFTVNGLPTAGDDSYRLEENSTLNVPAASGVLANDADPDGDPLAASLVRGPAHGTLTLNADGSFVYTPAPGTFGPDSFSYQASDGEGPSNTATVSLFVNAPPMAADDAYSVAENQVLTVPAGGVLANDTDPNGDPLTASLVTGPAHGSLTLNADGSFVYTPSADYSGPDGFTYRAGDGSLSSDVANVALTVNFVNVAPSFTKGSDLSVAEESGTTTIAGWASQIAAGPTSEAGQHLNFLVSADKPSLFAGQPAIAPDGTLTFTPAAGAFGTATVTVQLHDDGGTANGGVDTSPAQTFAISVVQVAHAPSLNVANVSGNENAPIPLSISAATTNTTGTETLAIRVAGVPAGVTLSAGTNLGNGVWSLTPAQLSGLTLTSPDNRTITLTVTATATAASSGKTASTAKSQTVTVRDVAPSATISGDAGGVRGQVRTYTLAASDPSPADQAAGFTYAINWGDGSPVQTVLPGQSATVTHVFAATGTYSVSVTATDKDGGVGAAARQGVSITAAALQPDPFTPGTTDLVVGGTTGADTIAISQPKHSTSLSVTLNGVTLSPFSAPSGSSFGRIVVYGQAGDDTIQVSSGISIPDWLFGGDGNDTLTAGSGNSVLVGGSGNDILSGGGDRDLLIGGGGADQLNGYNGDDIQVAGTTAFDANDAALAAIMAEWTSSRSYTTRVSNLSGTGTGTRLNGTTYLIAGTTVFDDLATDILTANPKQGTDWVFYDPTRDQKKTS